MVMARQKRKIVRVEMIQDAAKKALQRLRPSVQFQEGDVYYVKLFTDTLVSAVQPRLFVSDIEQGDGREFESKFLAVHSSTGLVVNHFAPFKEKLADLVIGGQTNFSMVSFEKKCPTRLTRAKPPNLDLVAEGHVVVAVESKFTETISGKKPKFSNRYNSLLDIAEPSWVKLYHALLRDPDMLPGLNPAQLIKHYFGFRTQYQNREVMLLYLFWEPTNWHLFEQYQKHREDVERFAVAVKGSRVRFTWQTYADLWNDWEKPERPQWLRDHVLELKKRYCFEI